MGMPSTLHTSGLPFYTAARGVGTILVTHAVAAVIVNGRRESETGRQESETLDG